MTHLRANIATTVVFLALVTATFAEQPALNSVPGKLAWHNQPAASRVDHGIELTITSGKATDWFVDPFDGKIANTAPMLLFEPGDDYVLSTKVKVSFTSKWDAGALMLWTDDHHWAKLSFELSPEKQPTMVTVVTRGLSDDCNSVQVPGDTVFLQIAKSGSTYVFYFSVDGNKWQVLRTFSLGVAKTARVGFESQSPAGAGTEVVFSEIRYSAKKITNIYSQPQ
jgi:uncharacterized protein